MDVALLEVSPQAMIIIGLMVVAVIKLVDQLFAKDWKGSAKIVGAALVGALVSLGVDGVAVLPGVAVALAGSGLITVASFVGKQSTTVVAPEVNVG